MSSIARKIKRDHNQRRKEATRQWMRYVEAFVEWHGVEGAMQRVWRSESPSAGNRNHHSRWVRWAARRRFLRERGVLRTKVRFDLLSDEAKK